MTPMPSAGAQVEEALGLIAEAKTLAKDQPELQALLDRLQSILVPPPPATPEEMLAAPGVESIL